MIIRNNSTTSLIISGHTLRTGESFETHESAFDTHNINGDGGFIIITTEYSVRHIENYGALMAVVGEIVGPGTLREIIVLDKKSDD